MVIVRLGVTTEKTELANQFRQGFFYFGPFFFLGCFPLWAEFGLNNKLLISLFYYFLSIIY